MTCCSKIICRGCSHANQKRENEAGLEKRCVFCREPLPESQEEANQRRTERIKKNCPVAMCEFGKNRYDDGDYDTSLHYFVKAAELGNAEAHFRLSFMYMNGEGVEKDTIKEIYHLKEASIAGHHMARHNLGVAEAMNGKFDRAVKHVTIAANLGYQDSLKVLRKLYVDGHASKEDYATALRGYQAALDAAKSAERDEAEAFFEARAAAR